MVQKMIENLPAVVVGNPVIEMESPFYLGFNVVVQHDTVPAIFIGDKARAMYHSRSIRPGREIMIREGFIDDGRLVFSDMDIIGNNLDVYV